MSYRPDDDFSSVDFKPWTMGFWVNVDTRRLLHPELFRLEGVRTIHCHVCGSAHLHSCTGLGHWIECPREPCICGYAERVAAEEACDYGEMVRATKRCEEPYLGRYCVTCQGCGGLGGGMQSQLGADGVTVFHWFESPEECSDCRGSGFRPGVTVPFVF